MYGKKLIQKIRLNNTKRIVAYIGNLKHIVV